MVKLKIIFKHKISFLFLLIKLLPKLQLNYQKISGRKMSKTKQ